MNVSKYLILCIALTGLFSCSKQEAQLSESEPAPQTDYADQTSQITSGVAAEISGFSAQQVMQATDAAAQWQLAHMTDFESYVPSFLHRTKEPKGWVQGTFFLGLARWAAATNNQDYFSYLREHGDSQEWELGPRKFHADDHVIAQYYLHLYDLDKNAKQIEPLTNVFDHILANKPDSTLDFEPMGKYADQDYEHDCQKRWCWSDALFMSPPVWFHLSKITGNTDYADYAHEEFQAVTEYLFDMTDHLYVRDSRFFDRRESNDKKIFWSRGNGWVFAGLTKILETLELDDERYVYYADIYIKMAYTLADKQASTGYWPVSLAAGELYPANESSGTAFFVAGMAWGLNQGLLNESHFLPVVNKGWQALLNAQREDGMLGYVQQIGYAPDAVSPDQTQLYGAGAFLLAGTQMLELAKRTEKSASSD